MAAMVLDYASVTGAVRVHSSPSVVPELLFAGMMLQFLASVGQLTAHRPPRASNGDHAFLTTYPAIMGVHLILIMAYVELGREEDARAEEAEIMRMSRQFTLASIPLARDLGWDKRL
jgi:hypothetical protein